MQGHASTDLPLKDLQEAYGAAMMELRAEQALIKRGEPFCASGSSPHHAGSDPDSP